MRVDRTEVSWVILDQDTKLRADTSCHKKKMYSQALIPVAKRALAYAPYTRTAKRIKFAKSIGSFAWNNRASIYQMARKFAKRRPIRRRYGRRKPSAASRLRRNGVGASRRKVHMKRCETGADINQTLNENTPYVWDLTDIPEGPFINNREKKHANISGIKCCMHFQNSGATTKYVNIAYVTRKSGQDNANFQGYVSGSGEGLTEIFDFYRSVGTERATDFGNASLDFLERHCRPINSDKFVVLRHQRFQLAGTGGVNNFHNNYKTIQKWLPVKRQVHYDGDGGDTEENLKIYMLIWYTIQGAGAGGAGGVSTDVTFTNHHITYFREPKN